MKNLKHLFFVTMIVTVSCNGLQEKNASREILSFIPGIYTRVFEGEYSKGADTLFISRPDPQALYFLIEHKSGYQKIRNKELLPPEYKTEKWTAIYKEDDKVLVEQKKGKLISPLPEEDALLLGSNRYNKIK